MRREEGWALGAPLTLSLGVGARSKFFFLRVLVSLWSSVVIERLC